MTTPVCIPADVDREDRLIGNLTARQLAILATTAALLYLLWTLTGRLLPAWSPAWAATPAGVRLATFAIAAIPIAITGLALALGRRDGVPLDRLLIAAARQRLATPTQRHNNAVSTDTASTDALSNEDLHAATGAGRRGGRVVVPHVPARGVRACAGNRGVGVVDLGRDGLALVCAVTPINLTLRSPREQDQLVAGLARWLHSLTQPVQVLVRTTPLDLTGHIADLHAQADRLPHPALAAAAHAHAEHLTDLAHHTDLLHRRIYLVFHEPTPNHPHTPPGPPGTGRAGRVGRAVRAAEEQLLRRADEADQHLAAIGARVSPLDPTATAHTLHAATHPDRHLHPPLPAAAAPPRSAPHGSAPHGHDFEPSSPVAPPHSAHRPGVVPASHRVPRQAAPGQPEPGQPYVRQRRLPAPYRPPAGERVIAPHAVSSSAADPFRWWPHPDQAGRYPSQPLDGHLINPAPAAGPPHGGHPPSGGADSADLWLDDEQLDPAHLAASDVAVDAFAAQLDATQPIPRITDGPHGEPSWSWAPGTEVHRR